MTMGRLHRHISWLFGVVRAENRVKTSNAEAAWVVNEREALVMAPWVGDDLCQAGTAHDDPKSDLLPLRAQPLRAWISWCLCLLHGRRWHPRSSDAIGKQCASSEDLVSRARGLQELLRLRYLAPKWGNMIFDNDPIMSILYTRMLHYWYWYVI